ncbi:SDR family NAD(P)-dependent oxidoreductase [Mucilaginibacter sp. OK098]|uniref:SDR family NAD(P)-dependent oxidoreductase n=1 Tax=Mucilaginibacter sp. OK098 TaxID=1855297 RepID=UPI000911955D|nr:SDR family NAD(P)-dependent oxidoreductase [Mucilaginibacter sp. OK098]SHM97707.1 Short-chain dehydrogenase [Mucilaginibacter sp. OK098]
MKKAIVVGASSGIGHQLAVLLAANGYKVGITGRRDQLLLNLQASNPEQFIVSVFDVTDIAAVPLKLKQLTDELGGLDLLVLSSGTGKINPALDTTIEQEINTLNVAGFTAIANWAFNFFQKQSFGHFVAITSIAGIRGSRQAPAYFASKAYQINYLEGLRQKAKSTKLPIYITDLRPGFVDTAMAAGENLFWVASVEKAALQIYKAIKNKRDVVYITKRWRIIAFLFWILPKAIHKNL